MPFVIKLCSSFLKCLICNMNHMGYQQVMFHAHERGNLHFLNAGLLQWAIPLSVA